MRDRVWCWEWRVWHCAPLLTRCVYRKLLIAFHSLNNNSVLGCFAAFWRTCWDWRKQATTSSCGLAWEMLTQHLVVWHGKCYWPTKIIWKNIKMAIDMMWNTRYCVWRDVRGRPLNAALRVISQIDLWVKIISHARKSSAEIHKRNRIYLHIWICEYVQ